MPIDLTTFKLLGEALALGLLVGVERYRGRQPGEKKSAGVRTFTILCLLGAVCGLFAAPVLTAVTFAAVAALVLLGYYRSPAGSLGLTTEFAALLVFWIGYLLRTHEAAAISLGIVLTIILAAKQALHQFVREQITEAEFEATLKFLAVVLVVYPILPDREMGPYGFFNPRHIWGLVILVSTISYAGYFLIRWLGKRRGLMLGSLVGGIVSTAAVTMSLADRARSAPEASRLMGTAAVLANAVQGPRLLLLLWLVDRGLARTLAAPLLGMAVVGLAGAWLLSRRAGSQEVEFPLQNPYSLRPALKFGLFFVAILLLVKLADALAGRARHPAGQRHRRHRQRQRGRPVGLQAARRAVPVAVRRRRRGHPGDLHQRRRQVGPGAGQRHPADGALAGGRPADHAGRGLPAAAGRDLKESPPSRACRRWRTHRHRGAATRPPNPSAPARR